jgi:hypothetical protein
MRVRIVIEGGEVLKRINNALQKCLFALLAVVVVVRDIFGGILFCFVAYGV